jgi:hypothetical protein
MSRSLVILFLLLERLLITTYAQFNALVDLAASGDAYSSAWHGPAQSFTSWGQLAALDVLVSAVGVTPTSGTTTISMTPLSIPAATSTSPAGKP